MIDLYTWGTPNGRKISIMLEELALPYTVHSVNIGADEQFTPEFLAISSNNKIPAIVDPDGLGGVPISIFETGAILIYLAEKTGSDLWPTDPRQRMVTLQWLMFQVGNIGPFLGQANHFLKFAKKDVPYAKERYRNEAHRLCGVMDRRLTDVAYLAGNEYSIADIACYPWVMRHTWHDLDMERTCPRVWDWLPRLGTRLAVIKGMDVPTPV
jgi:GST-like protein